MTYLNRRIDLDSLLKNKSILMLGPRSVGKTSLIDNELENIKVFDLLHADTYSSLLRQPSILKETSDLLDSSQVIVIDEIQKLPELLDEVHRILNTSDRKFLLTGSSARKLKRGGANLLAGRAWQAELFPLTYHEIPDFDILKYLNRGGLPDIYQSEFPDEELRAYVGTYLREEIQAESLTRNLPAFSRFLDTIAFANGLEINYESLASDCAVSTSTLKNYFEILEDTLLGFSLPAFKKTKIRKAISRSKHYLFDVGVCNELSKRKNIIEGNELFGNAFEHFLVLEVRAWNSYSRSYHDLTYWRSTSKLEVDLIIGKQLAVEIKATKNVQPKHIKNLRALKEEGLIENFAIVANDPNERITKEGIHIYHWKTFLEKLWANELI